MKEKDDNFQMSELIMVNLFNNWSFCYWERLKGITTSEKSYYFGRVDIEQDTICCVYKDKEEVARILEFIFSLKYHHSRFRKIYRTFNTTFTGLIMN